MHCNELVVHSINESNARPSAHAVYCLGRMLFLPDNSTQLYGT